MSLFDDHPLTDLDRKAHALLGDKAVVKSLAQQAAFQGLPRYVSEYLIAKYVKPDTWRDDLAKMQAKIRELLPDLEHREFLKERLLSLGEITLIDNVDARVDLRGGQRLDHRLLAEQRVSLLVKGGQRMFVEEGHGSGSKHIVEVGVMAQIGRGGD